MTRSTEMFFGLIRMSIHGGETDESPAFVNAAKAYWGDLFALSARQGTVLLAYGGLQYLPDELQPPRKLKLRWCANVVKGSERYDHHRKVITKLSQLFSDNGISMAVLKGLSISGLYPVPYYREGGDIDVYLFGSADKADKLIASHGIEVSHNIPKHSAFIFDGLMVENHRTFFDTDLRFRRESEFYGKMEDMLSSMFSKGDCPAMELGHALRLPAQAAALYFIGHTFRHFCCTDINIRQLCDWTVFLTQCRPQIDSTLLSAQIKELGLESFVTGINSFCSTNLGFRPYFMVPDRPDTKSERTIMNMVMKYRTESNKRIPVIGVVRNIFFRNRLYKKYLGRIRPSEFLYPELKSYFSYLRKRVRREANTAPVCKDSAAS